ncbi:MAG: prolyl oligopeptidase family serine peptidase, partial [Pseudomonadota bacterium]
MKQMRSNCASLACLALAMGIATAPSAPAQQACGDADRPCQIDGGSYHIRLPEGVENPPVVVFIHGWGSAGANALDNPAIGRGVVDRGWAYVAPNGLPRGGDRGGGTWGFRPESDNPRDEVAFITAVLADAEARHGVDSARSMLGGFSIGGSMTTYFACQSPETFFAYAPIAGSFWRPHPAECEGPVRLFHIHGWRDGTVPLEGRPLGGGRVYQGDVFASMEILRSANGCVEMRADDFETRADLWIRRWDRCTPGSDL